MRGLAIERRVMTTYNTPGEAEEACRRLNRHAAGRDVVVLVDGPEDGAVTLMPLREAITAGFSYRWEA